MSNDEKKGFIQQVSGVLLRPQEGFSQVDRSDLVKGILIVLVTVTLAAVSAMKYMSKIPLDVLLPQIGSAGVDVSGISGTMGLFSGIGLAFAILVGFILSTMIMHGVSVLVGGSGALGAFFAMHGFATIPHLVNYLLRVVDAYTIQPDVLVGYYIENREVGNKLFRSLMASGLTNVFGLAVLVYHTFAVSANYKQTRGRAFIVAFIPYLLAFAVN
ncbi:MAG: YIP1 family protein, partial [Dehalococcoidia bacterium]